ncbi:MAG: hypothetical protein KatS3mg114_0639 [Planctomycetaceae bacterium]|nr:MAG: hypothetical protein KatS3mg114_0639 [Planctomycetaceae bacterium]
MVKLFFPQWLLLFAVVSALDFYATLTLLQHEGNGLRFREGNPVARHVLENWGTRGLLYFKMGMVALVAVISQVVALRHPRVGQRLLEFGCLVVSGALLYSAWLLLHARGHTLETLWQRVLPGGGEVF